MGHQHVWLKEPPDGRTSDDKYGDMRDMAHNSFWTSKEELQRLRLLVEEDPEYETSSEWPGLVEWCSSCADSRVVKLVLSEEIKVLEVETSCDACTQTPRQKPRRRGGQGSRTRRMLSYQLMLSVKRGLPLSRLLSSQKTDARSTKAELLEESTLPPLKVKEEVVIKEEKQEEVAKPEVREEREDCPGEGVSTSGSSIFTLRNSQSGANPTSSPPHSISPFSVPPPPLFTPPFSPFSRLHSIARCLLQTGGFVGAVNVGAQSSQYWPSSS